MSKMERNSLSKSLKNHCVGNSRGSRDSNNIPNKHLPYQNMLKGPNWNLNNQRSIGGDHPDLCVGGGLISWPPRSYPCGFCKREFRSAQALGGHMNVHRRDRARLRQSSPPGPTDDYPILSLNPNPSHNSFPAPSNPKFGPPKFPSSSPSPPPPSKAPNHPCPSPSPTSVTNMKLATFKLCHSSSFKDGSNLTEAFRTQSTIGQSTRGDGSRCLRSGPVNLEIGLFGELKEDEVDLELRLGYS